MITKTLWHYVRRASCGLMVVCAMEGCSSAPPTSPALIQRYQDSTFVTKVEGTLREQELSQVPDWYLFPEKSTSQTLYSVSQASSPDLQVAMSKATLIAQFRLGEQAAGLVDGQKELTASDSESAVSHNYSQYARSLVKATDMSKASTAQQTVKVFQGRFYVYLQMTMPRPVKPVIRPASLDTHVSMSIQPSQPSEGESP